MKIILLSTIGAFGIAVASLAAPSQVGGAGHVIASVTAPAPNVSAIGFHHARVLQPGTRDAVVEV
ncbi:MAG TPA: hypothetical protein VLI93_15810 [Acetobacteraceae bacterium]|nr:hypothetical protein [Acetobacteraceae bacterium]